MGETKSALLRTKNKAFYSKEGGIDVYQDAYL